MILLDTHALIWLLLDDPRLGRQTRQIIASAWADNQAAVSAISFWEIAMLCAKGRIELLVNAETWRAGLLREGLIEIAVDGGTALRAGSLRDLHGDPADRIIVATALTGHQLVTADRRILDWPGRLRRLNATE